LQQHTAFVFPGQGSQRLGMLSDASDAFPAVRATFEEAADALGLDLWGLTQGDDAERLNLTENTQPALLCTSVALWRAWDEAGGPRPGAMAGHSLGEFSALCCAGAVDFHGRSAPRACSAVDFMQSAVPAGEGAMAAVIGLDDAQVIEACARTAAETAAVVQAVNFNSPGQVVIAGHSAAVGQAGDLLKAAGARRVLPLPVSAPFHTSLMKPAGEKLQQLLNDIPFETPNIPVVHNVHAATERDPARIKALLVEQISAPVGWTACIDTLCRDGISRFAECGAGRVLGGLLRRIDKTLSCIYLEQPDQLREAAAGLAA
jgi:[acyl-carrier-protein] S-malonyltransferase